MSDIITNIEQLDPINGVYTYADYVLWNIKERLEIIKGKIFRLDTPDVSHQRISGNLIGEFYNYFKGKSCKLFAAPFDVVFKNEKGIEDSVVQPDICVVCDSKKLENDKRCLGAPDLIIEILSPGNTKKEMRYKYELYEEAGVYEYWVVRPIDKEITQFVLENGKYRALPPIIEGDIVSSVKFPELTVATEDIFRL